MFPQGIFGEFAGGDGERMGADGFAAGDVVGGIANNESAIGRKPGSMVGGCFPEGMRAEILAVDRVVGEGPEWEVAPQIEVGEFRFRAARHISGQQALREAVASVDILENGRDSGENGPLPRADFITKAVQIGFNDRIRGLERDGPSQVFKNHFRNVPIGSSRPVYLPEIQVGVLGEAGGPDQGAFTRPPGMNQCSIDVPEYKNWRHLCKRCCPGLSCRGGKGEVVVWNQTVLRPVTGTMQSRFPGWFVVVLLGFSLVGCATGPSSRIKQDPETFERFPADVQENIRLGEIDIGYSKEMVEMALGEPNRVVSRRQEGREERVWIYTRSAPRFGLSLGTAYGTGSGGRSTGVGAGVGTRRDQSEETMRVVFFEGEVTGIEKRE